MSLVEPDDRADRPDVVSDRSEDVLPLDSPVQNYAWGSTTVIPELLGREPTGAPVAELWLGAHPKAPSIIDDGSRRSLTSVLASRPELLGAAVMQQFGQLPFLLKVLAVEQPLSLQAHPSKAQAEAGFAAENAAGIALDAPNRNYKDTNHKPEMIVALTPFVGLCGFRPVERTHLFLTALGVLPNLARRLMDDDGLPAVVRDLLTRSHADIADVLAEVIPAARDYVRRGGEWSDEASWVLNLNDAYPGDRGAVIALLMNLVQLAPGQSMFLPAGNLHAYLKGVGVELLANSDNVLRGGLTPKHIDVPALLDVLDIQAEVIEPVGPRSDNDGVFGYPSQVPDFELGRIELLRGGTALNLPPSGPRILLCTAGSARLISPHGKVPLTRGAGVFVSAGTPVSLSSDGDADADATVFVARPNVITAT